MISKPVPIIIAMEITADMGMGIVNQIISNLRKKLKGGFASSFASSESKYIVILGKQRFRVNFISNCIWQTVTISTLINGI